MDTHTHISIVFIPPTPSESLHNTTLPHFLCTYYTSLVPAIATPQLEQKNTLGVIPIMAQHDLYKHALCIIIASYVLTATQISVAIYILVHNVFGSYY